VGGVGPKVPATTIRLIEDSQKLSGYTVPAWVPVEKRPEIDVRYASFVRTFGNKCIRLNGNMEIIGSPSQPLQQARYQEQHTLAMGYVRKDHLEWMCELVDASLSDCDPEDLPSLFLTRYQG
jgi:hypothetical protein